MQIAAQMAAEGVDNQALYSQSWTSYKPGAGCNEDERYIVILQTHFAHIYKHVCAGLLRVQYTQLLLLSFNRGQYTWLGKRSVLTDVLTITLVSAMKCVCSW